MITDKNLDLAGMHAFAVSTGSGSSVSVASVQYTLNDGTTATVNAANYNAPGVSGSPRSR